jgi:serine protease Do
VPATTVQTPFGYTFLGYHSGDGWIGVDVEDGETRGARVIGVQEDGPAGEAGIREDDVITAFDGTNVLGSRQLARLTAETPIGRTVPLTIVRNGQEQTVTVEVGEPERQAPGFSWVTRDGEAYSSVLHGALDGTITTLSAGSSNHVYPLIAWGGGSALGLTLNAITDELRTYFGAEPGTGVLVASINDDSVAGDAGIRVGDVIVAVDGNRVGSTSDLGNLSRAVLATGNSITITVIRGRNERDIIVEPEN